MVDSWKLGLDGNWHDGFNWSDGTPTSSSDVEIDTFGGYTISLTDAQSIQSLEMSASGATLSESATGSLDVSGSVSIFGGTVVLRGTNTFDGGIFLSGGTLRIANANALGGAPISAVFGTMIFNTSMTLNGPLDIDGVLTLAAAHGKTFDFGSATWALHDALAVRFGTPSADGTVVLRGANGTIGTDTFNVVVVGGTLREGDAAASNLLAGAFETTIEAAGHLDLAGFTTAIGDFTGSGTILNSGGATSLLVDNGGDFSGTIKGAIVVQLVGGELALSSAQTYTGGTLVDVSTSLILDDGGSVKGSIQNAGSIEFNHTGNFTVTNTITGTGSITYSGGGTYTIGRHENSGETLIDASTVKIADDDALGAGTIDIHAGFVTAEASVTLAPTTLELEAAAQFSAVHGTTLTIDPGSLTLISAQLTFGNGIDDGVVALGGTLAGASEAILVQSGTLRAANATTLPTLLQTSGITEIAQGATLALAGFDAQINILTGAGRLTDFNGATITLDQATFGGVIAGKTALDVAGPVILTGTNTFTGKTTIESTGVLSLGNGGKFGSIAGNIVDNGTLFIDHSNAFAETAFISGSGQLIQRGTGTTTIDRGEAYSGGTTLAAGVLSVDRGSALGTGAITFSGGKLLITKDATFANDILLSGGGTIAAATGTTATFTAVNVKQLSGGTLVFGDASHAGTIDWASSGTTFLNFDTDFAIEIRGGTLKTSGVEIQSLFVSAQSVTVDAGAKLNVVHDSPEIVSLQGSGVITGDADAILTIDGGDFAGTIGGAEDVLIDGSVTLSGPLKTTGTVEIELGARLVLSHATAHDIAFESALRGPDEISEIVSPDQTLVLTQSASFGGKISGFLNGDTIDLRDFAFSSNITKHFNHNTDVLRLSDGTHSVSIAFDTDFDAKDFKITHDAHGGTEIVAHLPMAVAPVDLELG